VNPDDLSTWPIDRLEAFTAEPAPFAAAKPGPHAADRRGLDLETVRELAGTNAYWPPDQPRTVRLRWARLSLQANRQLPGVTRSDQVRKLNHDLQLRTWIVEHFGPFPDPDLQPEAVAADTLAALTLTPDEARAAAADWRDLPTPQILELRHHKNLTEHLGRLIPHLPPDHDVELLHRWITVRTHLP
jgi:hypothetical protein